MPHLKLFFFFLLTLFLFLTWNFWVCISGSEVLSTDRRVSLRSFQEVLKDQNYFCNSSETFCSSVVAQMVKNLFVMLETQIRSLGQEDPLEKEMATHFSILAWRIPMDRGVWRTTYSPWGHKELDITEWLTHTQWDILYLFGCVDICTDVKAVIGKIAGTQMWIKTVASTCSSNHCILHHILVGGEWSHFI